MAKAAAALAPARLALRLVEIGALPLYNQDLDTDDPPAEWRALREQIRRADAILFVTPEYNRSMPGVLKNAIDIASRPYGQSAFDGKPGAVISVSPGAIGGFGANQHLRQSCVFLNLPVMQQPEAYIGGAAKLFDEQGALVSDSTKDFVRKFLEAFAGWIEQVGNRK
jgi:chromate reductase